MENAARALEIAAGVMLGVMLMAVVAYFFSNISSWPQNQDDIMSTEQLAKFNQEYIVFLKKQMYGVDVISCLNKVISNNKKYAQGGAFLGGNASLGDFRQRENYWINVKIQLKDYGPGEGKPRSYQLKESMEVYYTNDFNKEVQRFDAAPGYTISSIDKLRKAVEKVGEYTGLTPSTELGPYSGTVDIFTDSTYLTDGYYSLFYRMADNNISDMNLNFIDLLQNIQTLGGNNSSDSLSYIVRNNKSNDYKNWTQVVWRTALYDLKKRKFTCVDITYNTTTGRVNEIIFQEI